MFVISPNAHPNLSAPSAKRQAPRLIFHTWRATKCSWFRRASVASLFLVILASGCGPRAGLADHGSLTQAANLPPTLLQPSISRIDLGTIARGGNGEATIWLFNNGTKTLEIAEIMTSCDCFEVTLEKKLVLPGEKTQAKMKVDFAHEPNFTGSLGLRAEGVAKTRGELAFVLSVEVVVK